MRTSSRYLLFATVLLLIGISAYECGHAATPQPKPPIPISITFTQGPVTRSLTIPNATCTDYRGRALNGPHGQTRFFLECNGIAQGSFVQFQTDAGPIYPQWTWPAPQCGQKPAIASQHATCPPGTEGAGWTQTHDWACSGGAWQALPWVPADPPPGACSPVGPPPFQWQPPRPGSTFPTQARVAKGASYASPYGALVTRVTDHTVDAGGGQAWLREDYNRRQSLNADDSLLAVYQPNGFWDVFDAHSLAFVKRLAGPAGDSEFQWDSADPNIAYYLPINGGTVLYRLDVGANTSAPQYDFTAAVTALWPTARRCWTKSEGSPSADGRIWGLMCETDAFTPLGFVALDVVARHVLWSMPNSVRPDNVTITPSGRWFIRSGNDSEGTKAYAIDGSQVWQLHPGVEHADIGVLPNGDDFFVSFDYTAGVTFVTDIDVGPSSRRTLFPIYGNAWLDNVPPHPCANCAGHWSAKAFRKPGWAVFGSYGTPPANIVVVNVVTGAFYGLAVNYVNDGNYFDEPHCFASRSLNAVYCNENWGTSLSVDVVRIDVPELP